MKTIAIIPSGGSGKRTNADMPKQYIRFNGKELIAFTLEKFQNCELIDEIVIAAKPEFFGLLKEICEKYGITKLKKIVEGGKERQDSVFNALSEAEADDDDLIAVHDAARPLLPDKVLVEAVNQAKKFDNVVVAIKAKDTLIHGEDSVDDYLDRNTVWYVQTPQIFKKRILHDAMIKANEENFLGTDESMLVKKASNKVRIVEGSALNFKVTTKSDLELFERLVK